MSRKADALKVLLKKFGGECEYDSIDEILEAIGECEFTGGGGASSWSDLAIQNRVLYDGEVTTFDARETLDDGTMITTNDNPLSLDCSLIVGEVYTVTFDGQVYKCEAKASASGKYIGDEALWMWSGTSVLPFALGDGWFLATTEGTHALKIEGKGICEISGDYLPNTFKIGNFRALVKDDASYYSSGEEVGIGEYVNEVYAVSADINFLQFPDIAVTAFITTGITQMYPSPTFVEAYTFGFYTDAEGVKVKQAKQLFVHEGEEEQGIADYKAYCGIE